MRIRDVGLGELKAGIADGSILVVDVREDAELAGGMIPGSLSMPLSRFEPERLPVDGSRRLVFSCAAGVRSLHAVARARAAGLDVHEHFGLGFKGWLASGEPVD